jgi:23S rRNA (uracil1939-C5)-methyltransferase
MLPTILGTSRSVESRHALRLSLLLFGLCLVAPMTRAFTIPDSHGRPRSTAMKSTKRENSSRSPKQSNSKLERRSSDNTSQKSERRPPQPSVTRPVLLDFEANRNPRVNRERLSKPINCEHFGVCSGCIVNENVGEVDIIKSAKSFFSSTAVRKNRLDVLEQRLNWVVEESDDGFYQVVVPSDVTQWRTQAKLAVAPKSSSWSKDGCQFGLYQKGSHKILPIPNCQVHHPSINRAVEALMKATLKAGTPAFSSDSWEGGLRYVQLQVERTTGKICLTLVWAAAELKFTQPALSRLTKELTKVEPDLWHSMWCHCNDGQGNNIFSRNVKNWYRLSGLEYVREPLPVGNQGWVYYSPLVFRQGNIAGFDVLANDVARRVPGGSKLCELYAGVGGLGLSALAYHGQKGEKPLVWVRCSDENPANKRCFSRSVESL